MEEPKDHTDSEPTTEEILEVATSEKLNKILEEHGACIIGGIAVEAHTGVKREHSDIDIICTIYNVFELAVAIATVFEPDKELIECISRMTIGSGFNITVQGVTINTLSYNKKNYGIKFLLQEGIRLENPNQLWETREIRGKSARVASFELILKLTEIFKNQKPEKRERDLVALQAAKKQ